MSNFTDCLIGFGSNLGDGESIFLETQSRLRQIPNCRDWQSSTPLRTTPVGGPTDQPDFLNAVFRVQTQLSHNDLHDALIQIENGLGRERRVRWGARRLDLDLLLFGQTTIHSPALTIPHPRMSFRRFVLEPAGEIAGQMLHPLANCSLAELLKHLDRRPNEIVWVTTNNELREQIVESILRQFSNQESTSTFTETPKSNNANWKIWRVETRHDFDLKRATAKLLVWDYERPAELLDAHFVGPQLQLFTAPRSEL